MPQIIKLKRSATPGQVPTVAQLDLGELAVNTNDGKLFFKKDDGTPVVIEVGGSINGTASKVTSNTVAPTNPAPVQGDLWFDTVNNKLMYYDGAGWVEVASTLTDFTSTGNTILGDAAGDTLTVNATSTFQSPVDMNSTLNVDGNLTTTANTTLGDAAGDTLTVNATSTFNSPVDMNSTLNVDGAFTTTANTTLGDAAGDTLTVNATSTFNSPVTMNSSLTVADGQTFNLGGVAITDVRKFNIYDSAGSIVNGFYVIDTDTTINN